MTDKQKVFCEEYLIDLNATQAAIRAGYSTRNADSIASGLMAKSGVRARIDKLLAARSRRTGVNADRVVLELARVAFLDATDVINIDEATVKSGADRNDTAGIASVKCKTTTISGDDFEKVTEEREIKLHDKIKALELLGKHLGMYTDKSQVDINGAGVVILPAVDCVDEDADPAASGVDNSAK